MPRAVYPLGIVLVGGVLVAIDRSPSDVANQATLLILALGAALLGAVAPRRAWLSGILLGGCLGAAHAAYLLTGTKLPYPMSPSGWAGPLTLLVLLVPALLAARAGAAVSTAVQRRRRTP